MALRLAIPLDNTIHSAIKAVMRGPALFSGVYAPRLREGRANWLRYVAA